ncbi:hypothetical protein [Paenibacillus thermotolerans]|nr:MULTISPECIES: hypothetical protein [unclassified Paenibacillus]
MRDEDGFSGMNGSDMSVWRGILFGISFGAVLWAGILWLAWKLLF